VSGCPWVVRYWYGNHALGDRCLQGQSLRLAQLSRGRRDRRSAALLSRHRSRERAAAREKCITISELGSFRIPVARDSNEIKTESRAAVLTLRALELSDRALVVSKKSCAIKS